MTAIIVLAVLVLTLVAALERNHRRTADPVSRTGLAGGWTRDDRDVALIKLDLTALRDPAEPLSGKQGDAG
jgi:hypothetical protein